jgi:CxxC motif-containing protein (DUF1111 family)
MKRKLIAPLAMASAIAGIFLLQAEPAFTQVTTLAASGARDPGVRFGPANAGDPIPGLTANERAFFDSGLEDFSSTEVVADGLGPRMNLDSCSGCHSQPAVGGTSPAVNPQVAFANKDGGTDSVPSFVSARGPVREARFVRNPDGTADGGVHALFTLTGRTGAAGCNLAQPDFAAELAKNNVIFRIPTPVFGAGLIEQIPDETIRANAHANSSTKSSLGIFGRPNLFVPGRVSGVPNTNGNDGTITRFGWKAQNKSLMIFSGEAYNVEMGITNETFQQERDETPSCQFATVPNDTANFDAATAVDHASGVEKFSNFQRFLAPPAPSFISPGGAASIGRGKAQFGSTGCALCHTPSMKTGNSTIAALRNQTVNLYSDLLVHDMGDGLSDGVTQGGAGPREFRSAPLWGLGKRIFFLHDGRTSDLVVAIRAHASTGSEANAVVARFNALPESAKQDLLNFLRSL